MVQISMLLTQPKAEGPRLRTSHRDQTEVLTCTMGHMAIATHPHDILVTTALARAAPSNHSNHRDKAI